MSSNRFLIDRATRRSVFIQRFAAGRAKDAERKIGEIYDKVEGILAGGRPGFRDEINRVLTEELTEFGNDAIDELVEFANDESQFSAELFERATKADDLDVPEIDASIGMAPMFLDSSLSINNALSQFGQQKAAQVNQIINDGFTEGKTHQEIVGRVSEELPLHKRQVGALVRTATNAVATEARFKTMEENSDLFSGYEWVSTLDSRTTFICMSLDGKVFEFSDNNPRPPAHWGCRSTVIPKVKRQFDLLADVDGDRPSVGAEGPEQVSANLTYAGFLRRQPKSFQDEVLGPERAKLFRAGKLTLDSFVDDAGRTLTLDQLRALNPMAFE